MLFQLNDDRNLPAGLREVLPLLIGLVGILIPVALVATAASGESIAVLVLAILAMIVIGGATMTFMMILTTDKPESDEDDEAHAGE